MSQENVEIVRRATDAYNRGDLDGMLANWAEDAVLDWSNARSFDAGVYRGTARSGRSSRSSSRVGTKFASSSFMPGEVEDDLLIAENVTYMRGRDGIEVQARSAWLITIRDGEQTSLTLYQTKQEALEAAGLPE